MVSNDPCNLLSLQQNLVFCKPFDKYILHPYLILVYCQQLQLLLYYKMYFYYPLLFFIFVSLIAHNAECQSIFKNTLEL